MRDYDEITAFLGEWGPFQKIIFFLLSLIVFPTGFCGLSIVFVGDVPEHRCLIPGNLNLSEAWLNRTIPLEQERGKLQHSQCRRYRLDVIRNLSATFADPDSINMSEVEQEPCLDGWEYSKDQYISTIVSEVWEKDSSVWNLGCTYWIWHASGLLSKLGNILHSKFPYGSWTDFKLCGCLCSWVGTPWKIHSDYILCTGNLHFLCIWLYVPASGCILHTKLAVLAFHTVSNWPAVHPFVVLEDMKAKSKQSHSIIHLVKIRKVRAITIINFLMWMILSGVYFGLSLNTSNLHGDNYLNCFLSAAIEVPAYVAAWLFLRRFPRRFSLSGSFCLAGIVLFSIQLISSNLSVISTVLVMIGKFGITSAFAIVYVYCAELYATTIRNMGVGMSTTASRVGSIISPYIFYLDTYHEFLPFILMGGLAMSSAIGVLFLPETVNVPLPDTIDQMQTMNGFKCGSNDRNHNQFNINGTSGEANAVVSKKEEI
ncbi:solute carrier family 22 member 5-like isoform X2 [Scyliorhinus canicula]|uniref:solute carrier family 22 member 5-like isoform X2 n=1 Tax=Scyliorhinus canicula TaxID=7830 RepID=UPI0018F6D001|nr:solute carrier family 22 member 5-like isoform X2 [Scyliorhinus canicula]